MKSRTLLFSLLLTTMPIVNVAASGERRERGAAIEHVLLLSIDRLHAIDAVTAVLRERMHCGLAAAHATIMSAHCSGPLAEKAGSNQMAVAR
jgi:hypothetical protein